VVRRHALGGDRLQRAADQAALCLVRGLPGHWAAEGRLSPQALKAVAEHLGILREVAKRHPGAGRALLPHLDGVRRFATSSLFYAFCRRNPKLFRLWGSVLADVAFFFDDLSAPHREFLRSFPLEEMIEGEPADFRRLDAADLCARSSIWNGAVGRAFSEIATSSSLLTRGFPVERFDTTFVYQLTHLTFYASRWGATCEPFTEQYYQNLDLATRWSTAVADADLVAECVVAGSYSRSGADRGELVELVLARQLDGGAIRREPSAETTPPAPEYAWHRHTTLVGLWALTQYAHDLGIELSLDLGGAEPEPAAWEGAGPDAEELRWLEGLISSYAGVAPADVPAGERERSLELSRRMRGLRPFRCEAHHLRQLHEGLPDIPAELSLARALVQALLEMAGGGSCDACSARLLQALRSIAATRSTVAPGGDGDRLRPLIERFLDLPIVSPA
jgi:hypothetical protein